MGKIVIILSARTEIDTDLNVTNWSKCDLMDELSDILSFINTLRTTGMPIGLFSSCNDASQCRIAIPTFTK